ncbi:RNA 2',3'-cyclic phosphodiesterase [Alphaproteobacteria bacterium SO-S41]|nr:RNA 2',3'-cyclic phosphodiesterase [Alphaproteobacteria bacterium SO-S41]
MPRRFTFAGYEGAAKPTDRLFYAVFPPKDVAAQIGEIAQQLRAQIGLKGRPQRNDRFHATINHIDDYIGVPPDILTKAIAAGDAVSAAPFDVTFNRAASFSGRQSRRPFVLRGGQALNDLKAFQQKLGIAMKSAGLGKLVDKMFVPHVTMLYDGHLVTPRDVDPISWRVTELVLVHSMLGDTKHIPLKTWPLMGSA